MSIESFCVDLNTGRHYVHRIEWTVPGQKEKASVTSRAMPTREEAFAHAKELAMIMGWRRPKWYEWRRRGDKTYDKLPKKLD